MNYVKGYCRPESVEELLRAAREANRARFLAGGTDLLVALRSGRIDCGTLIDLSGVGELRGISDLGDAVIVGSMMRMAEIARNEAVGTSCRALAEAASQVGSPLIRNRATIGGNVVNCAAAGDSIPALLALDAEARVAGPDGTRFVPVSALLGGVNTTTLRPEELIVSFRIPTAGKKSAFLKFGPRKAIAISNLSVALAADTEGGSLHRVSLALGAVGVTAYRVPEIEELLEGVSLGDMEAAEAAAVRLGGIVFERLGGKPEAPFKAPYKRNLAYAGLKRAVAKLREGATQ